MSTKIYITFLYGLKVELQFEIRNSKKSIGIQTTPVI